MSVTWDIEDVDSDSQDAVIQQLTFEYKKSMIFKDGDQREGAKLTCAKSSGKTSVLIPLAYAKDTLGITNDYTLKKRDYKQLAKPRDENQKRERREVIDNLKQYKTVSLNVRTGAGKTALSCFAMCKFKAKTAVLVHSKGDCEQWANAIRKYTTATVQIVELNTKKINKGTDILVCLYTRWKIVPEKVRYNLHLLVIDEYDVFCNPSGFECIINFQPLMILGCTATPECPGTGMGGVLESFLGKHIVTRPFDVKFDVVKILTNIKGKRVPSKRIKGCDWTTLKQSLIYNPTRILMVLEMTKYYLSLGRKLLLFTSEVKYAQMLYVVLTLEEIECDYMYETKKTYRDSDVLIGTTQKIGRGFDEENGCKDWGGKRINTVCLVDFGKNKSNIMQNIGRAFRADDPIIVQFVDEDQTIERQWEKAEGVYKKLNAAIEEMEYDPKDFVDRVKEHKKLLQILEGSIKPFDALPKYDDNFSDEEDHGKIY